MHKFLTIIIKLMHIFRLCRAIALAAEDIKLTSKQWSVKDAVLRAQKCTKVGAESDSESLEGFLALTDGIIYAIKIADPNCSENIEKVR